MDEDVIKELTGKVLVSIEGLEQYSDQIVFKFLDGSSYIMYHEQDCCEGVSLEDFDDGISDKEGAVVLSLDVSSNDSDTFGQDMDNMFLWTFYTLKTNRGDVWMRWLGQSNGYYGVDVTFRRV